MLIVEMFVADTFTEETFAEMFVALIDPVALIVPVAIVIAFTFVKDALYTDILAD